VRQAASAAHQTGMNATLARLIRGTALLAAVLTLAVSGAADSMGASAAAPFCGITWGSLPRAAGDLGQAPLAGVRTGHHDCFDRVVFDFSGPATGYRVQYVDQVLSQGRGVPLDVAGGARLDVVLLEPADGYPHGVGDHVAGVSGFRTLRAVVYGGTFEGSTTFGVGVRARLPFRVLTLAGPGAGSRIVLDVAHRWSA
jgi:hypothetical protein